MKKIILSLAGAVLLFITACDDQLDINTDPDSISVDDVAFSIELPAAISGVAGVQGSYYAILGGLWSQMYAQGNTASQYRSLDRYELITTGAFSQTSWTNMYDALGDMRNIKRKAELEENWKYYLIATTLEVYTSQILTNWFGDVPYSEANNIEIFSPKFDTQEEIYNQMIVDLDSALSKDLDTSVGDNPGQTDFVFQGDMEKWTAFANTLKLKIYLSQTKVRASVAQAGVASLLTSGVDFLGVDAAMTQFIDEASKSNPLYETNIRQLNTSTNLRASNTMYSYLKANSDTRLDAYYNDDDGARTHVMKQGAYLEDKDVDASTIVGIKSSPYTSVFFISKAESLYLQAEAELRYGSDSNAKTNYEDAVRASFIMTPIFDNDTFDVTKELDGSSFVSAGGAYEYPVAGSFDDKLEKIIIQRWIASYPGNGFESFFTQLRTGYPEVGSGVGNFTYAIEGITGGLFPQRIPYPYDETVNNKNSIAVKKLTVPTWLNK
ncbi:MAG: SusD/RagB family nutrient-binding outer membrane lipoprotein [Flavobacteriaceae bacterium]|nr:SusD/RagB family nutrient-binding outer membrane lipoprotein [Flavobacteriaceae bacterium]